MRIRVLALGLALALLTLVLPTGTAYAHEGWFVSEASHSGEHFLLDLTILLVAVGSILFLASVVVVDRSKWYRRLDSVLAQAQRRFPAGTEWKLVAVLSAVMLTANAITGVFLAPDLVLPTRGLVILGGVVQLLIGLLLLSKRSYPLAGLLTIAVALPLAGLYFPAGRLLDYLIEFAALALAFIFAGLGSGYLDRRMCKWLRHNPAHTTHLPLPVIRVGIGLTFVVLALHNKLLSPSMALTFLDQHDLNFLRQLGFSGFTNLHFVFAAGMTEVALGLLLAAGVATRFVAVALVAVFLTTLAVLGPIELLGHLPLIGIAVLLVFRGSGGYRLAASAASGGDNRAPQVA